MKLRYDVLTLGLVVAALSACGDDTAGSNRDQGADPADASTLPDVRFEREMGSRSGDSGTADRDGGFDMGTPECVSDADCTDGVFCNGIERCSEGMCFPSPTVQCADYSDCTADLCDEENQRCQFVPDDSLCAPGQICRSKGGCFTPADCALDSDCDDGLLCNGTETCSGGECQPGEPVECGDGIACTTDACVEGTGECQSVADHGRCLTTELCRPGVGCAPRPPCTNDDDCDDALFCNGRETCGAAGVCEPGVPPLSPDNIPCTIDQCVEALKIVRNTPDNARCSDGLFCNGAEVCHPVNGCGAGTPPVLSDGVGCTVDTCNETLKLIEHEAIDANCDDGLFCNGTEVCHPVDDCSPGEPPMLTDGIGCTIDTCSEVNDEILHVAEDSLCDDGLFCNGVEVCDPVADCVATAVPTVDDGVPCTVDSCDEGADQVVNAPNDGLCASGDMCTASQTCDITLGCVDGPPVDEDDGVACTIDSCDPVTGVAHDPSDAACDDGMFCNGVETCHPTDDCQSGVAPADDGNPCTIDSCNEQTDTVSNTPVSEGTVCGSAPRSICRSGGCVASFCGDGYVDAGNSEQCDDGGTSNGDGCSSTCQTESGGSCDPDGVWNVSPSISYSCSFITISNNGTVQFQADGAIVQGVSHSDFLGNSMNLVLTGNDASCPGSFSVTTTISGGCPETYTLSGTFTSANSWTGTFTAGFQGGPLSCGDCTTTTIDVSGSR